MIKSIGLQNFRRFDGLFLTLPYNLVILVGDNAVGKTTILESIYFCSTTKSHRTNDYKELIKTGMPFAHIKLQTYEKCYDVVISEQGKKMRINQDQIEKLSDFVGDLKAILFSPNDLLLVTGEKSLRRNFFDLEMALFNKKYLKSMGEFRKLLKKRNEILKAEKVDDILLETVTDQMIEREIFIMEYREKYIELLNSYLQNPLSKIEDSEIIKIVYNKSIQGDIKAFYKGRLAYDKMTKMTNNGVHRDDFVFYMNDSEAKTFCSQGQIRSIAISLKIALSRLIQEQTKSQIVLLLDDVFSELDINRQKRLVSFLLNEPQTFITTTSLAGIPKELLNKSHVINLKE